MKLLQLIIENFRCIEKLDWMPSSNFTCIVGPGDIGKTTILDAIEWVIGTRWLQVSNTDFFQCDTTKIIKIFAVVGKLPEKAMSDNSMGLSLLGWDSNSTLQSEPNNNCEVVVKVELTVDETFEPEWNLIDENGEKQKSLSQRDRSLFGLVRVGNEVDRHLSFGQKSALSKVVGKKSEIDSICATVYRKLKESIKKSNKDLEKFKNTSEEIQTHSAGIGAYSNEIYKIQLDIKRSLIGHGAFSLHDGDVPIRLAGLGTRRLVALTTERLLTSDGAIVLIDEIEHGLEPHRIRQALKTVQNQQEQKQEQCLEQVILTTHSLITIVELKAPNLAIIKKIDENKISINSPGNDMQPLLRRIPEAFLCKKIIVCEGKTEIGLLRGIQNVWKNFHNGEAVESKGVVFVNGEGSSVPKTAIKLKKLGFNVIILRDSDVSINAEEEEEENLQKLIINILQWDGKCSTEMRVMKDVSDGAIQKILNMLYQEHGERKILNYISSALFFPNLPKEFLQWEIQNKNRENYRKAIADVAREKKLFKRVDYGEKLGEIIAQEIKSGQEGDLFEVLKHLENWSYG